jgi:hypothetical protein
LAARQFAVNSGREPAHPSKSDRRGVDSPPSIQDNIDKLLNALS